jgi:hypothetical protein
MIPSDLHGDLFLKRDPQTWKSLQAPQYPKTQLSSISQLRKSNHASADTYVQEK